MVNCNYLELSIYDTFPVEETRNTELSPTCIVSDIGMTELPRKIIPRLHK